MWLFILLLSVAVIISLPLRMFVAWCFSCHDYAKIKYKDFQKYYDANPSRWYCDKYKVTYLRYINTYSGLRESFNFGFIDFCKYYIWQRKLEKEEKLQRRAESLQRMLDDINKTEA